jgi:mannan endo-1,4-beta-mannosidase
MRPAKVIASAMALACTVAVGIVAGTRDEHAGAAAVRRSLAAVAPVRAAVPASPAPMVGVYVTGTPDSVAPLDAFTRQTGVQPRLVLYFSGWHEPFNRAFADAVSARGGMPLVQVQPDTVTMLQVASGSQDAYLVNFAQQVRAYGRPVVMSFGHEMNGSWYSWGFRHVSAAQFIAAWRHVVDVFREQGADNVTWMWTVNAYADAPTLVSSASQWWPGDDYVDWVGVDGHYLAPGQTFTSIFMPVIDNIREVTAKPVLIAETAIAPQAGQAALMANLFAGVRAHGLLGLVWFDSNGNRDFRLRTSAALASFGAAARLYGFSQGDAP